MDLYALPPDLSRGANVAAQTMEPGCALVIYPNGTTLSIPISQIHPTDRYHRTIQLQNTPIPRPFPPDRQSQRRYSRQSAYEPSRPSSSHRPATWHEPRHDNSIPKPPPVRFQSSHPGGHPPKDEYKPTPSSSRPPRQDRPTAAPGPPVRFNAGKLQSHSYGPPEKPPAFRYSSCKGNKRAVCIGINYTGQEDELKGCANDAKSASEFLVSHWRWNADNIMVLTDETEDTRQLPTRKNMIAAMNWLVQGAKADDFLFFHYSGHGGQTEDTSGDEHDNWDEVIFPLDHRKAGHILDDEMHDLLVKPLPAGCRLVTIYDSCHSGTALDLSYIYSPHCRLLKTHVSKRAWGRRQSPADVISLSACADTGTAADTYAEGKAVGAMSHALMKVVRAQPRQTYAELMTNLRRYLRDKYKQKPQLSSSHPIDTSVIFIQ